MKYLIERDGRKTVMTLDNILWLTNTNNKAQAMIELDKYGDKYRVTPLSWLTKKERKELIAQGVLEAFETCLQPCAVVMLRAYP